MSWDLVRRHLSVDSADKTFAVYKQPISFVFMTHWSEIHSYFYALNLQIKRIVHGSPTYARGGLKSESRSRFSNCPKCVSKTILGFLHIQRKQYHLHFWAKFEIHGNFLLAIYSPKSIFYHCHAMYVIVQEIFRHIFGQFENLPVLSDFTPPLVE